MRDPEDIDQYSEGEVDLERPYERQLDGAGTWKSPSMLSRPPGTLTRVEKEYLKRAKQKPPCPKTIARWRARAKALAEWESARGPSD